MTVTASTNLLPQAQRDTDAPDLGFHYDPLDFILAQCIVTNATLNLSNGVAIGYFNQGAGVWLQDNSAINSVGSPLSPNWFAHYTLVQEQPVYIGNAALSSALAVNPYHYGNTGPNGLYRFTRFASPGGAYLLIHSAEWAYSNLWVQDCQFWNGWNYLEVATNSAAVLKNNLFERSSLDAYATARATLTLSNNLVRNTEVMLLNLDGANLWRIHDNAFDHCDVSSLWMPLTNSHNAYISCSGRLQPTNVNDVVLTNFSYVTGPLGDFYQASTNLQNAGSVTDAGLAGLYHYTTLTNQTKEADSRLDIGFHYVAAMDNSGEPMDTDHGGVPDYLEDANSNGTVNTNETEWRAGHAADDDLSGVYGSILVPRYLRCEYRQNPLGVETNYGTPRLYWIVTSNRRAQKQSAHRLLVASSEANLNLNYGDMWDGGIVPSDQTLHVEYKGNALASGQRLWWKVRSWDAWGSPSPWSTNAFFQMGLLSTNDWTGAKWIGVNPYPHYPTTPHTNPCPMFRSPLFVLTNQVARATAYVSAKGVYEFWLNGYRIGPNILAPEWTDYNRRIQYQSYDVTAYLTNGTSTSTNVMGAFVGEGWCYGPTDYGNYYGIRNPQFLLQLSITNMDGSMTNYFGDANWLCSTNGPIRSASIYVGENYDARQEGAITNWCTAAYSPLYFTNSMSVSNVVSTQMVAQVNDPIQITQYLQPINKWTASSNASQMKIVYDLGQNIAGWCILSLTNVANVAGTAVKVQHGEALNVDGNNNGAFGPNNITTIYRGNLALNTGRDALQEENYILNDSTNQQFHPHFTYHGFRYVEVWAPPAVATNLNLNSITGCVIHSSVPMAGAFWVSDARACTYVTNLVSKLVTNASWSLRANLQGVFTAVPQRPEREGYMFDSGIFSQSACFYADMAGFLTKWIRDIRDAQAVRQALIGDGAYTVYAP